MKVTKKTKKTRNIINRFKSIHVEHGRIIAAKEYNERLLKLSNDFDNALKLRDRSHEIALVHLKTQEKIFAEKNEALDKKMEILTGIIEQMRLDSEKVAKYASNLEASWQDEKVKKWTALNHDKNEAKILLAQNEKNYSNYMNKQKIV